MARTRTQLRQLVAQQFQTPFLTGTSDATGGSTTTLVDTPDLSQFANDAIIGGWLYLRSGSPTFRNLRITDHVQSTGTATFRPTIGAAPDALDYELLPFSAESIHQTLDEVLLAAYDAGHLSREIWLNHWVAGSPIYNSTFDYWPTTTTIDGWTASVSTLSQRLRSTDHVIPGEYAVRVTNAGTVTLDAKYRHFLQDFAGYTVTLYAWVRSSTASASRVQLLEDGTVQASTGYHNGDGTWALLSVTRAIPAGVTEITVRLDQASANGDFGAVWLTGGPVVREYPLPFPIAPDGPDAVYYAPVNIDTGNTRTTVKMPWMRPVSRWSYRRYRLAGQADDTGILVFEGGLPPAGARLWLPTSAPFTLPTADADNVELTLQDSLAVAKMVAARLVEKDAWSGPTTYRARATEFINRLRAEAAELFTGKGATAADSVPLGPSW